MTASIIDTAENTTPQIVHLKADGIFTAIRYLSSIKGSSKLITPAEAVALGNAGIRLGLVFENGGGSPGYDDINEKQGAIDGAFVVGYVDAVGGMNDGSVCVYFACDNDFSAAAVQISVLPYFKAVAAEFVNSGYLVGVYGSGSVCGSVIANGYAAYAWLSGSKDWRGSKNYLAAKPKELRLVQDQEGVRLANMNVDTNYALGPFGDFMPFVVKPAVIAASPKSLWQRIKGALS
jgi:Domain of unknown function (DUF1906)